MNIEELHENLDAAVDCLSDMAFDDARDAIIEAGKIIRTVTQEKGRRILAEEAQKGLLQTIKELRQERDELKIKLEMAELEHHLKNALSVNREFDRGAAKQALGQKEGE